MSWRQLIGTTAVPSAFSPSVGISEPCHLLSPPLVSPPALPLSSTPSHGEDIQGFL